MMRSPPKTHDADSELLTRASRGSSEALDELFRRHRDVAYRVAYRLLGQEADALDAVQDGFVNAITHMKQFRAQSSFRTWLLRIVSNAALDLGRSRRRRDNRFAFTDIDALRTPQDENLNLERNELRSLLDQALSTMPEAQRQTFVLHVDGELSYQEIAETLNLPLGTVMSRLFYARQRLKTLLAEQISP